MVSVLWPARRRLSSWMIQQMIAEFSSLAKLSPRWADLLLSVCAGCVSFPMCLTDQWSLVLVRQVMGGTTGTRHRVVLTRAMVLIIKLFFNYIQPHELLLHELLPWLSNTWKLLLEVT